METTPPSLVPVATVVIVTFNSVGVIDACLESLAPAFPGTDLAVVVADSGSTDGIAEHLAANHAEVRLVRLHDNLGFAAGINAGARYAPVTHALLVLNPDVRMQPEAGSSLLAALDDSSVGIAVPCLIDESGELQLSLRRRPTVARALGTALLGGRRSQGFASLSEVVAEPGAYLTSTRADWATGAAMLISADCRRVVGAWDESYFLYSEETDYCLRAGSVGFGVQLVPAATAVHLGGESTTSPELWSVLVRNRVALYRRTHRAGPSAVYAAAVLAGETARAAGGSKRSRAAVRGLLTRRPKHPGVRTSRERAPGWVCFAGQDWWYHNHGHSDFQLMTRIAKDRTVLFVNSIGMRMPVPGRSPMVMKRLLRKARSTLKGLRTPLADRPRFHVLSPVILPFYGNRVARLVNRQLVRTQVVLMARWLGIRQPILIVTIPTAWEVVEPMDRRALLFNRSDKHSAFKEVDTEYIERLEEALLRSSDSVLYVSHALMDEDAELAGTRSHFLDHGVDLDHFTLCSPDQIPDDLLRIPGPRIGFFGGIDDYVIDLELLAKVAARFPDASLVLIGDATCPLDDLEALPNVHLMGPRPYSQIPAYGSGFHVALMPWLDNDWIKACNPIKVKEYLALGLPIVTTWYPEVGRYEDVVSASKSHEGFLAAIAAVLDGERVASAAECRSAVLDASWDARADQLRMLGEGLL